MQNSRTVCISHSEDVDGLTCASFLLRLKGASPVLVSYDEFEGALRSIAPGVLELFVCDINVREELYGELLRIRGFADVTIVDHHPTARDVLEVLERSGVTVVYSPDDCASVLLYDHYRGMLGRGGARFAAYAAISDQFEEGPIAVEILKMFDRPFAEHEALILTHALGREATAEFRSLVVEELSRFTLPHMIKGAATAALDQLDRMSKFIDTVAEKVSIAGRLAYSEASDEVSLGTAASLIIDAMDVDVGVSYKKAKDAAVNVSVRGRRGLGLHLGEVTKTLAERHGGFGGGHSRASGATIPQGSLMGFISDLEAELERVRNP